MKATTKQLYDLLLNDELISSLEKRLDMSENPERQETSLKDAIRRFFYMKDVLTEVCETGSIDILPLQVKSQLVNYVNQLYSQRGNVHQIIDKIEEINKIFLSFNIESILEGREYQSELQQAIKEKQEYRKVSLRLRKGLKYVDELEPKLDRIRQLEDQTVASAEKIESNRKLVSEAKDKVLEDQKNVDSQKVVIGNTFEDAETIRETLRNANNTIEDTEKKYKGMFDSFSERVKNKTQDLLNANENIQNKVNELLQGATAGKLHEAFITRKKELESTLNGWLYAIILLNLLIIGVSYSLIYGVERFSIGPFIEFPVVRVIIAGSFVVTILAFLVIKFVFKQQTYVLKIPQMIGVIILSFVLMLLFFEGFTIPEIVKINLGVDNIWMPIIKLLITVPLIILDWFLIKEYSYRKDIIEKYTFKSAISISLFAYEEIIKKETGNTEALKFINNSIEKIYKDPFESDKYSLGKKEKELLTSLMDGITAKIVNNSK